MLKEEGQRALEEYDEDGLAFGTPAGRSRPAGLPRRRAHAGAVPRLLLPAAAVVHGNYERWERNGGNDATARASLLWREALDEYQQPPLGDAIRDELQEYVVRRRAELGD